MGDKEDRRNSPASSAVNNGRSVPNSVARKGGKSVPNSVSSKMTRNTTSYQSSIGGVISADDVQIELASIGGGVPNSAFEKEDTEVESDGTDADILSEDPDAREEDGTKKEEKKPWDPFRENKMDTQLYSYESCFLISKKLLKILFIVIAFSILLGGIVISKMCILMVTSNLNPEFMFTTIYTIEKCNKTISNTNVTCGQPVCKETNTLAKSTVRWIWCMFLCLVFPYLIVFIRSIRKILFKEKRSPSSVAVITVILTETLHTAGLTVLTFVVLPRLDVTRGALLMAGAALLPAVLRPVGSSTPSSRKPFKLIMDCLAILVQLSATLFFPLFTVISGEELMNTENVICDFTNQSVSGDLPPTGGTMPDSGNELPILWFTPLALACISISSWENFVDDSHRLGSVGGKLYRLRKQIQKARTKIIAITSLYKTFLTFLLVFPIFNLSYYPSATIPDLFDRNNFYISDCEDVISNDWLIVWGIHAGVCVVTFFTADIVVKGAVQKPTLTLATFLGTPVTLAFLYWACTACGPHSHIWNYETFFYWNCFSGYDSWKTIFINQWVWFCMLWILSQWWISRYMWVPRIERLAKMDHIFMNPTYCGALLEQSLIYSRRRNDKECSRDNVKKLPHFKRTSSMIADQDPLLKKENDEVPKLFLCATMWHENRDEMVQILKSIFRLDDDHRRRRYMKEFMKVTDPDYYQFEAHVFFDDAFDKHKLNATNYTLNSFVKQLTKMILVAAFSYHGKQFEDLRHPLKYPTPYGGRLVYTLPGSNTLVIHMKDKMKIRHRKRWSQVMYMRYLLGQRLWGGIKNRGRKDLVANNTYLLALDGDVDFKPDAVLLLVDMMKRNSKVGAACGRIHPIGKGPMVWYQKFEYSISHWLQKATEHVLGCVLCSPGCFSLFRASAIMDDNVIQTYTKEPETPVEHVQYDQGEDRWLCTLLLQQGYRVEYSAAADALTYAPEGFNEFFNQRRRWTPSTMANIMDLLASGSVTVHKNENISMLYMIYQGVLFVTSIIGPGTIFLLLVGALENALMPGSLMWAFILILVPLLAFFIIAMTQKTNTQLILAAILSGATAVLQMVVFVSLLITLSDYGLCNPSAWMLGFVVMTFVTAAILHPQESSNLVHIFLFFLLIPTMYLILLIYALCNLNNVSWGTREVTQTEEDKQEDQEILNHADQTKKQSSGGMTSALSSVGITSSDKHSSSSCSCGPFCSLSCCFSPGKSPQDEKLELVISQNEKLMEAIKEKSTDQGKKRKRTVSMVQSEHAAADLRDPVPDYDSSSEQSEPSEPDEAERDDMENPLWCEDEALGDGDKGFLSPLEVTFWEDLITKYLYPLDLDKKKKERLETELRELRNKAVLAFFMINVIFIVLIQTLQVANVNIAWNCTNPINGKTTETAIEPIGLSFVIIFGFIMVLQVAGMLLHRLFSLLQIISATPLFTQAHEKNTKGESSAQVNKLFMLVSELDKCESDDVMKSKADYSETKSTGTSPGDEEESDLNGDTLMQEKNKISKIEKKQPKYTAQTMDKYFATRFLAMHMLSVDPERDDQEITNVDSSSLRHISNRRQSVFDLGGLPHMFHRRKTQAPELEQSIEVFRQRQMDKSHLDDIKGKYGINQEEIKKQEEKLRKRLQSKDMLGTFSNNQRGRQRSRSNAHPRYSISEEQL